MIVSFSLVKTGLDRQKIVSQDLEAIVKLFAKNDKKVYLLIQPPFLDYSIQKQILVKNSQDIIGPTRLQWKNQNNFVYSILKRLPEDVVVLDAADVFVMILGATEMTIMVIITMMIIIYPYMELEK